MKIDVTLCGPGGTIFLEEVTDFTLLPRKLIDIEEGRQVLVKYDVSFVTKMSGWYDVTALFGYENLIKGSTLLDIFFACDGRAICTFQQEALREYDMTIVQQRGVPTRVRMAFRKMLS